MEIRKITDSKFKASNLNKTVTITERNDGWSVRITNGRAKKERLGTFGTKEEAFEIAESKLNESTSLNWEGLKAKAENTTYWVVEKQNGKFWLKVVDCGWGVDLPFAEFNSIEEAKAFAESLYF